MKVIKVSFSLVKRPSIAFSAFWSAKLIANSMMVLVVVESTWPPVRVTLAVALFEL